ncbi:MAG TPA: hypothetical protein VNB29_11090, partial [Chthoniobacterales bacterium]|nr:hypothetical protein [Chthoniobacterales bacterium]
GVNDSLEQAAELARITKRLDAKVNVIPYNTVEGLAWVRPSDKVQDEFMAVLRQAGAVATLRREKGHDISAACGQLRLQTLGNEPRDVRGEKPFADAPKLN